MKLNQLSTFVLLNQTEDHVILILSSPSASASPPITAHACALPSALRLTRVLCVQHLTDKAKQMEGLAQWPFRAVAQALEVIPRYVARHHTLTLLPPTSFSSHLQTTLCLAL